MFTKHVILHVFVFRVCIYSIYGVCSNVVVKHALASKKISKRSVKCEQSMNVVRWQTKQKPENVTRRTLSRSEPTNDNGIEEIVK